MDRQTGCVFAQISFTSSQPGQVTAMESWGLHFWVYQSKVGERLNSENLVMQWIFWNCFNFIFPIIVYPFCVLFHLHPSPSPPQGDAMNFKLPTALVAHHIPLSPSLTPSLAGVHVLISKATFIKNDEWSNLWPLPGYHLTSLEGSYLLKIAENKR